MRSASVDPIVLLYESQEDLPVAFAWPTASKLCCLDTACKTSLSRAANGLRLLSDKSVAKQVTWLEEYHPRWITMLLQWCILLHHVLAGIDEEWWPLSVCVGHISFCFVTSYDGWYNMCVIVYMIHSLFCHTVTDDDCERICVDGSVCISMYVYVFMRICQRTRIHQSGSFWVSGLVWALEVLFAGWWIKASQREGGTGSVRALLASLSSGRHWEWLADPFLTLVRQGNPSNWLKCHLIADNKLIIKQRVTF